MEVDLKMLDRILELFFEASSWVKTQVESFFKLLRTDLIKAFLITKPLVINCCEKLKLALAGINDLIDGKVPNPSETDKPKIPDLIDGKVPNPSETDKPKIPEEISLLDELKKLIQKLLKFVGRLTTSPNPELRRKGQILQGFLALAQGLTELLQLNFNQPLKILLIFVDGYLLYKSCAGKQVGNIACKFANYKEKAAMAIAALLSLISITK